jgi:hypothetical protein
MPQRLDLHPSDDDLDEDDDDPDRDPDEDDDDDEEDDEEEEEGTWWVSAPPRARGLCHAKDRPLLDFQPGTS